MINTDDSTCCQLQAGTGGAHCSEDFYIASLKSPDLKFIEKVRRSLTKSDKILLKRLVTHGVIMSIIVQDFLKVC